MIDDPGSTVARMLSNTAPDVAQDAMDTVPDGEIKLTEGIPIHGIYCGPGHGDDNYNAPPIDGVDAACMRHDRAYGERGYFDFPSDARMIADQVEVMFSPDAAVSFEQRANAFAVAAAFAHLAVPVSIPVTVLREGYGVAKEGVGALANAAPVLADATVDATEVLADGAKGAGAAAVSAVEDGWDSITSVF